MERLVVALLFSHAVTTLFRLFSLPILGSSCSSGHGAGGLRRVGASARAERAERTVLVVTAGLALWNMAVAYLAGLDPYHATTPGLVRLS